LEALEHEADQQSRIELGTFGFHLAPRVATLAAASGIAVLSRVRLESLDGDPREYKQGTAVGLVDSLTCPLV
jgi:hypothetical protein